VATCIESACQTAERYHRVALESHSPQSERNFPQWTLQIHKEKKNQKTKKQQRLGSPKKFPIGGAPYEQTAIQGSISAGRNAENGDTRRRLTDELTLSKSTPMMSKNSAVFAKYLLDAARMPGAALL
jgi:hypothetical protein